MFEVDLSYETVQPMIEGKSPVKMKMKSACSNDDLAYDDLTIFVPEKKELIYLGEGIVGNLFADDVAKGYVDYVNYTRRDIQEGLEEIDGGMMLFKKLIRNKYSCLADTIPELLEYIFDEKDLDYAIIR